MALSRCTVETTVNKAVNKLGFSSLKSQQMMAINEFINGRRCVHSSAFHIWENNVYLPSHQPMALDELYSDS